MNDEKHGERREGRGDHGFGDKTRREIELDFFCAAGDGDVETVERYIARGGDLEIRVTEEEEREHRRKRLKRTTG